MTDEPDQVVLQTPDLAAAKRAAFEDLFPGVVADGVLDATRLGELLDTDVTAPADGRERFGLLWAGKQDAVRSLLAPSRGALIPEFDKSVNFDAARNVFIEGDNLETLKLLQKAYNDKIDVIYVDPPYNTGQDFIYSDDYSDGLRAYLEYTGQVDDLGNRRSAAVDTAGRKHSRWLSMMYPRMTLARNLLRQDGVIFVSIDDNEIDTLKRMMNEIYGEENLITILAVEMSKTQGMKVAAALNGQLVKNHEYILVYARNITEAYAGRKPLYDASEVYDNHYDIVWDGGATTESLFVSLQLDPASVQVFKKYGLTYTKVGLKTALEIDTGYHNHFIRTFATRVYRESPIALPAIQALGLDPGVVVKHGKYLLRANSKGTVVQLQAFADGVRDTDDYSPVRARATIRGALWKGFHSDMMNVGKEGGVEFKNGKKPVRLVEQLVKWANRADGVVLDFFAGSGTTGHAVMNLNAKDGGARRYVLVQIPEPTGDPRFPTVADMTDRRIRNIMDLLSAGSGFRKFRLSSSSFRDQASASPDELFDMRDFTLNDRQYFLEEIGAEVLLKEGVPLDASWLRDKAGDARVITAEGVAVVMSLDITDAVVSDALALKPRVLVFLEDGFAGNDAVKANAFTNAKNLGITMKTV